MKFYAYKPNEHGGEPLGSGNKLIFELGTLRGAVKRCERYLGTNYRLYIYSNFYDDKTFRLVHTGYTVSPHAPECTCNLCTYGYNKCQWLFNASEY